ncbi:MAG TPA: minichromosome maintenance protein MCM, partial [Dissulfurispiraceae bacterium]|nr:minichromosome maintenance protein MCM [Dissulfurispiraceae bacterium]
MSIDLKTMEYQMEEVLEDKADDEIERVRADISLGAKYVRFNFNYDWVKVCVDDFINDFDSNTVVMLQIVEKIVRKRCPPKDYKMSINVINVPDAYKVNIRDIREKHIGKLIAVDGMVKKITENKALMVNGVFKCARCSGDVWERQDGFIFREPLECGDCKRTPPSTRFGLIAEKSEYVDFQKLEVQESPEGMRGGQQPSSLTAYLTNELVGQLFPGNRVTLFGVLEIERDKDKPKGTVLEKRLRIISVQANEKDYDNLNISEEEYERIRLLSQESDLFNTLIHSVCPTMKGNDELKEIALLQLFGGTTKNMSDGSRLRGDVHILWVGDPGISKSVFLRYITNLAPRGIYASGRGTSGAGLTAAAVQDKEFAGDGKWTLEAGALVLADMGFCAIDEIEKMNQVDRNSLHVPMEAQELEIHKAGIHAKLPCRCAVMAAMNPKYGKFSRDDPLIEQINLDGPLLSRFDVIYITLDEPEVKRDSDIATHILGNHQAGQKTAKNHTTEVNDKIPDSEFMRKYISEGRKIIPQFSEEVVEFLRRSYVELRNRTNGKRGISTTPRQLEAIIRMSEASARARMSETVTIDDAHRAVRLMTSAVSKLCPDGDVTSIMTGFTVNSKERIKIVTELISMQEGKKVSKEKLTELAKTRNLSEKDVERALEKMRENGEYIVPKLGWVE